MPRSTAYAELWGIVEGAVDDAFGCHPDYLTPKGRASARTSVVKRVTGTVLGFAAQAARGRPLQPAANATGVVSATPQGEGALTPSPHCRIGKVTFRRWDRSRYLPAFNATTTKLLREVRAK